MYKCLLYFFTPCVRVSELERLKEELISHLTHLLVKDQLAREVFKLCRFSTLKEEDKLAQRCLENKGRTMPHIGVESLFCLDAHIEYLSTKVEGLSPERVQEFFNRPFRQAVDYVKVFDKQIKLSPQQKMDYIEKISRSFIAEIDDYYLKNEREQLKPLIN